MRGVLTFVALGFMAVAVAARQGGPPPAPPPPARDSLAPGTRPVPIGTASITGTVTAADTGRPLKNVRVSLVGTATSSVGVAGTVPIPGRGSPVTPVNRAALTDTLGQFSFQRLPAGEFNLTAMRSQYLATNYGQKKPGRPGSRVVLIDGQQMRVALAMVRGGVITGVVVGDDGEPVSNAQVRALRYAYVNGFKRLQQSGAASTDDRGVYRLFNLTPGDYVIGATPSASDFMLNDRLFAENAAVEQAIAAAGRGGPAAGSVLVQTPPQSPPGPPPGYLATYYPGVLSAAAATTIPVNAGEERPNVDIQVQLVQATTIQGVIMGIPASNTSANGPTQDPRVQVTALSDDPATDASRFVALVRPNGQFTIANVAPGVYTVFAQTLPAPMMAPAPGAASARITPPRLEDSQKLWGKAQVKVNGEPSVDVSIAMQAGRTISGTVVSEMSRPMDFSQNRVSITLSSAPSAQQATMFGSNTATVGADGRFTMAGVLPGKYTIRASALTKSAMVGGEDILDFPLDVTGERDITDVVVTLTDKTTELSGVLADATGKPSLDYVILLVSRDQKFWTPASRRILMTRPNTDGRYVFNNVPPGDYLIAALTDLEPGMQYDPEFLKSLEGAGMPISLAEGSREVRDIRLAK